MQCTCVRGREVGRAAQMCSVRVLGVEKMEGQRRCAVYVCARSSLYFDSISANGSRRSRGAWQCGHQIQRT